MEKRKLIEAFEDIMCDVPGICGFISNCSNDIVIDSLREIENNPITKVQFDQLLSLQEIKCISDEERKRQKLLFVKRESNRFDRPSTNGRYFA